MDAIIRIQELIIMYESFNEGNLPSSIVVSRDIYRELQQNREISDQFYDDKIFGILISVLQGNKNNQIIVFGQ